MKNQRPEDYAILKAVEGKDVVVVAGSMDHIEQVLAAANIRHTLELGNYVRMRPSISGPRRTVATFVSIPL